MSAARRFFAMISDPSVLELKIDTRNIVAGATNGSENPLTYTLLDNSLTGFSINAILQVSDGRADKTLTTANFNIEKNLTFATEGVYIIRLIGKGSQIRPAITQSLLKLIEVSKFGFGFELTTSAFTGCTNLMITATDLPNLKGNMTYAFRNIKGFSSAANLGNWDMSKVSTVIGMFQGISQPMMSIPQGFFSTNTSLIRMYESAPISTLLKIEIIAPMVTTSEWMFYGSGFRGELILKAPNNTNISQLYYGISNPSSLGAVDIRSVTMATNFITFAMTTANVDATLLGWVNNFDWSAVPTVTNKVTFDFYNSKYSNNSAVIAAKTFLEAKGIVFTRLTMAMA